MYKFFLLYMPAPEKENEKDPSAALGMTKRREPPHSFSSHLGSQPPPLRGTSFRGKEGVCRLLASSFRAKARNPFRSRSDKHCEEEDHGKHRTSYDLGGRREYAAFSHRHFERKREILFVRGQISTVRRRITGNTAPPTTWEEGGSMPPSRIVIPSSPPHPFSG